MENKNKYLKKGITILMEFAAFIIGVAFFYCIYQMGFTGIRQIGKPGHQRAELVEASGIEEADGGYCTADGDSWMIFGCEPGYLVNVEFEFADGQPREGRIYYAGADYIFSEGHALDYTFENGENLIKLDDKDARYLRMDITDEKGVRFDILSADQISRTAYALEHINYAFILLTAAAGVLLFELFKMMAEERKRISAIFTVILALSVILIFGQFITGKAYFIFSDIGSDTYYQYYPYFVNSVLSIQDGTFGVWNWDYGLGTSVLNVISWTMDPFAAGVVLCGVLFGAQVVQYALVWMQIAKIFVSYFLCKRYLRLFSDHEFSICLGAYLYSLNGYLMLWGQHYFLGTACIYVLLVFIAVEKFVRLRGKKEGVWLALAVAAASLYSYYTAYMILAVAAVYFLVRYFALREGDSLKDTVKIFGKCIFSVLTGLCLAGLVFIPACYYTLTNSSRLDGVTVSVAGRIWHTFLDSFQIDEIGVRLSRLMSNNLLYINDRSNAYFGNYYETPQFFCTVFIFFFIGQWIVYEWKKAKNGKQRIMFAVGLLLMYLLIFNTATGLILNGFTYVAYRYTFIVFPLLALGITLVWEKVIAAKQISVWGLAAGVVLSGAAWLYSYRNTVSEVENYVALVAAFLFAGTILLILMWRSNKYSGYLASVFLLLIVAATITDGYITNNQRTVITKENYPLQWKEGKLDGDTARAVKWIREQDTSFYRMDKNYGNWGNLSDSFFEKYSAVTWYNSTPNTNISMFYDHIYKDASIYENASLNNAIKCFSADTELAVSALDLTNTKYILSLWQLDYPWCEEIHREGSVYVYRNLNTDSVAKWYSGVMSKEEFESLSDEEQALVLRDTLVVEQDLELEEGSAAVLGKFSLEGRSGLTGNVTCGGDGLLMIAIPDQEGWSVWVDGEKAKTYNADYGFVAVRLEEGEHEVSAWYRVPKIKEGFLFSLLGIVMLCGLVYMDRKNQNKEGVM